MGMTIGINPLVVVRGPNLAEESESAAWHLKWFSGGCWGRLAGPLSCWFMLASNGGGIGRGIHIAVVGSNWVVATQRFFGVFTPKIGGKWIHFDVRIFFKWVGSTTNKDINQMPESTFWLRTKFMYHFGEITRSQFDESLCWYVYIIHLVKS